MGLLVVWMLAATRRGAGVFGGFEGVFFMLLMDWALVHVNLYIFV